MPKVRHAMQPMVWVPRIDPRTNKPKMKKYNHRTFGVMVGFDDCRLVPKGSEPELERWWSVFPRLAEEFLKTH